MITFTVSEVLPCVIPFLSWEDRNIVAQTSREVRSIILNGTYEEEAFLHIAKYYNCYIETFDYDENGKNPYYWRDFNRRYQLNDKLLNIKTWLGGVLRTERMYAKHLDIQRRPLRIADEEWSLLPDARLDQAVKCLQFLSSTFVVRCRNPSGEQHIKTILRYTFPFKQPFSINNFLKLKEDDIYVRLCKVIHSVFGWTSNVKEPIITGESPLIQSAVRLVFVDHLKRLPALKCCTYPCPMRNPVISSQPYVARAIMTNTEIYSAYVARKKKETSPYVFTRWLTDQYVSPDVDSFLAHRNGHARYYFLHNPDPVAHLDLNSFWDLPPRSGGKNGQLLDEESITNVRPRWDISGDVHEEHALSRIEEHLKENFLPFSREEADKLVNAYRSQCISLNQVQKSKSSVGAYLEVSLNNHLWGPNDELLKRHHAPGVGVLYIGARDAALFAFQNDHLP